MDPKLGPGPILQLGYAWQVKGFLKFLNIEVSTTMR